MNLPVFAEVQKATQRLQGYAYRTPVVTSRTVNQLTGAEVFFKCENFQRTGSFKFRGAFNALSQLSEEEKSRGVLTFSSGNHAQAIARSGQILGIPTTIIMPSDAPVVKQAATQGYGAEIILYERAEVAREILCQQIATERDCTIIPPYDHRDIIAGQGTTAFEFLEEVGTLDILLVCCGGGGLLSGCAIATRQLAPNCQIIGVEPENADDATRSFKTKILQKIENPKTIADGARTSYLGKLTFPLILQNVDQMVTVSEKDIIQTMFFVWERMKLVIEPTGALAAAALLQGIIKAPGSRIGVVISGGNVDLKQISQLF
ncbi:threo-3-hydroxy-L-aspartate ammonia-lyase [Lyngbya sp. PCC 8106]|uniref:threo-3-hydroxy-L-aspartate ammonia-lyase n=1 Tax=Lyngbya sp. (strain PCC 8106) TaxID=313612 RepID=UPI0000EAA43F|nr:threo-3-hydroxy-L-aspartate ammonia-lyase [Lyngbya sp. PCC 8106]EAW34404.1 Pyridoxal-5'-phosphate-dependent enzyme, beta subunit [Lyngbya sp. PCC 8106]